MAMILLNRTISFVFPVVLSLGLGGCVSAQKYPEPWTREFPELTVKAGDNCDIAGSYSDAGEPPPGQKGSVPVSLLEVLFPGSRSSVVAPDYVSIEGPRAGELKVVVWKDGQAVETRQLKSIGCMENGPVMVNPGAEVWHASFAVTFGAGNQDNYLYRGSDGWLILKRNDLVIVFPWFKYQTSWYRFRPVSHPK